MLFNGAYLVEDRARFEEALAALAEDYRESGIELELTGPWPPYNFVPSELGRA
jgi:gas vesicle protein GvpL/GvpF